jgi:hypothetical protein
MENTLVSKGNAWTNFVRDWATRTRVTYKEAIKDPAVSQAYKQTKKQTKKQNKELGLFDLFERLKKDAVTMAETKNPPAEKKKAGRPSKYGSDEERKEAKRLKTLASNKKKREEISKKKKEGTLTGTEKDKLERDADLNKDRKQKIRDKTRKRVKRETVWIDDTKVDVVAQLVAWRKYQDGEALNDEERALVKYQAGEALNNEERAYVARNLGRPY